MQDRLHRTTLFIGQLLVRASCSFFVGTYFFQQTIPSRHDHYDDDHIMSGGAPAVWEETTAEKTKVDQDLAVLLGEIQRTNELHSAPSLSNEEAKKKYAELCSIYPKNCKSTLWDGSYERSEKYLYQGLSIALLQEIDHRLTVKNSTQNILSQLKIYQNDEERRGSAGHTTVKINSAKIPTSREYREVLTHELGHVIDLGVIKGSSYVKNRSFTEFGKVIRAKDDPSIRFYTISRIGESTRKADASFKDFVSGYAMKGIYEDFAETQNLRFNHNLLFQELANNNTILAKKYAYFKNLYSNKWFDDNAESIKFVSLAKRPWDTTRITE